MLSLRCVSIFSCRASHSEFLVHGWYHEGNDGPAESKLDLVSFDMSRSGTEMDVVASVPIDGSRILLHMARHSAVGYLAAGAALPSTKL